MAPGGCCARTAFTLQWPSPSCPQAEDGKGLNNGHFQLSPCLVLATLHTFSPWLHGGVACVAFGQDRSWEMECLGRVLLLGKILCEMMPSYNSSSPFLLCHDRRNHSSCGTKLFPATLGLWGVIANLLKGWRR